jgi:hypothetical protein
MGGGGMMQPIPFETRRAVALEILSSDARLTRKAGSFLGQLAVDPVPMSPPQEEWFGKLAQRAGLSVTEEGRQ